MKRLSWLISLITLPLLFILSSGCTRSVDSQSKLTFQMPSSSPSAQSTEVLARVIINIREPNGTLLERFTWVNPCSEDPTENPQCAAALGGANDLFQPPPFSFDATAGRAYFVQVLGVYLEDPTAGERLIFKYDEETAVAQDGDTQVPLFLANISVTNNEARLIGRYIDSAGNGPTGTLNVSFQPSTGTFPMDLFDEVIIGGWFNIFAIDGAQFTYKLGNSTLIDSLDPTPGAQPDVTDETPYRKRILIPQSYREEFDGGSSIPTYEQQEGGEVIIGFFGPGVQSNPSDYIVCFDDVDESPIEGMFTDLGSISLTFDTQLSFNPNSIRPYSVFGGVSLAAGDDCSTMAMNNLEINYSNFDGWAGGLGGFLSAYKDQNAGSTISSFSEYLQTTSSTVVPGGEKFEVDWEYLQGVYGSAVAGTDVFVVDTNRESELRDTEYWDCGKMAFEAQNFSGLGSFGSITRFAAISESPTGGATSVEIPQSWLDNNRAEAVLCPFLLANGSKSYLPAGVGNHGFGGGGCTSCGTIPTGPTPTHFYSFAGPSLDPDFTFGRGGANSTYIAADGTMSIAAANVPRFDHDPLPPHDPLGLLLEKARTNLVTESEALDSAFWGTPGIVTANTQMDPMTSMNADVVDDTDTGALEFIQSSNMPISNNKYYTASFFVKKTGPHTHWASVSLGFTGGTIQSAIVTVDTQTCLVFNAGGGALFNHSGQDLNTYCRFSVTAYNSLSNTSAQIRIHPAYNTDGTTTANISATGANVFWGVQLEESTFPSSYIPASGGTSARLADYLRIDSTTADSRFSSAEKSLVIGAMHTAAAFEDDMQLFTHGVSGSIGIRHSNSGSFNIIDNGGGALSGPSSSSWAPFVPRNFGIALADFDSIYAEDGSILNTDSSRAIPSLTGDDFILGSAGPGTFSFNGYIFSLEYFDTRLSNSELEDATSP